MKVVYTPAHLGHNPHQEIAWSQSMSPAIVWFVCKKILTG